MVAQLHLCLADSTDEAVATVRRWWPQQGLASPLLTELARPEHVAAAVADLTDDTLLGAVVCCNDAGPVLERIAAFAGAGYTDVVLHQVGPDQDRLFALAQDELLAAVS